MIFCYVVVTAQGLRVSGARIVDHSGKEIILRGMGLGGWMLQEPYMMQLQGVTGTQLGIRNKITDLVGKEKTDIFYQSWLENHCTKADIDSMASWGFNSVRLPIHYNLFTLPSDQEPVKGIDTWLEKGFALTDSLLRWCEDAGIYLILDLHAAPGGQGNDIAIADRDTTRPWLWGNEFNKKKTIELWKQLAKRYANEKWLGAYDILNEPNYGFSDPSDKNGCAEKSNAELKQLYLDITKAIRQVDKNHIIIIEGNCWGNNYNGLLPFEDNNYVISFHKYWNHNDEGSIKKFIELREQYQVPIWCGETGENSNVWFADAIELFEKNRIGWAMWPLKKIGINNPLEILPGARYYKLLDYWKGKGTRPSAIEAEEALMHYSRQAAISKNRVHRDVLDAMFRQPFESAVIPFAKHRLKDSFLLFAVDYDLGRNGFAYQDKEWGNYWVSTSQRTDGNKGRMYRNDGADITVCKDSISNGYCVFNTEEGEWLQYTINVPEKGIYGALVRYASNDSSGSVFSLVINNKNGENWRVKSKPVKDSWKDAMSKSFEFNKGENRIRLFVNKGNLSFNYIKFTRLKTKGLAHP